MALQVMDYGDAAVLVTVDGALRSDAWIRVHALADRLVAMPDSGIEGVVATFDSVLIEYDPSVVERDELVRRVHAADRNGDSVAARSPVTHTLPVRYGGDYGPDLDDVAAETGLSVDQFIEQHASTVWRIAYRGAPAGAPVLDGSPFEHSIARCVHPRIRVPAGSLAVSGHQAVVYPIDTPGGWRLVGRTPLSVLDTSRDPHVGFAPGDYVRFIPISGDEEARLRGGMFGRWT